MRALIFGAGAIGRYLAAVLRERRADVTLAGRGETVRMIASRGLRIERAACSRTIALDAIEYRPGAGCFDVVFVCVKSHQLAGAVTALAAASGPHTPLVFPQNGLPWWYFQGVRGPLRDSRIACLDLDGTLARAIDPARIVGAVIYKSVQVVDERTIRVVDLSEDRLILGELDGFASRRLHDIAGLFDDSGLSARATDAIRVEKWRKLISNVAWNPVCTLTRSTIAEACEDAGLRELCATLMREALAVARRLGDAPDVDPQRVLEGGRSKTGHTPSMLQDLRAGRSLEHAAIVGAPLALARLVHEPAPTLATIAALLSRLGAGERCRP